MTTLTIPINKLPETAKIGDEVYLSPDPNQEYIIAEKHDQGWLLTTKEIKTYPSEYHWVRSLGLTLFNYNLKWYAVNKFELYAVILNEDYTEETFRAVYGGSVLFCDKSVFINAHYFPELEQIQLFGLSEAGHNDRDTRLPEELYLLRKFYNNN
jgi:hypothetical protein